MKKTSYIFLNNGVFPLIWPVLRVELNGVVISEIRKNFIQICFVLTSALVTADLRFSGTRAPGTPPK